MAMPQREPEARAPERELATRPLVSTGSFTLASLFGLLSLVLAVLGLVGVLPVTMAIIGVISIGVALLLTASALMASATIALPVRRVEGETRAFPALAVPLGIGAWILGGVGAIVLGILAFFFPAATSWVATAALLSALALLLGGGWARTRSTVAPGVHGRVWHAADFGRGSDLWGGVLTLLLALAAVPFGLAVFGGLAPSAGAAAGMAARNLVLSAVAVLGSTLLISSLLRAWAFNRTRM